MLIFIDESGPFCLPQVTGPAVSCVAATVIPSANWEALQSDFTLAATAWPKAPSGEIKGRLLSEEHFFEAISILAHHGVWADAVAIDMGLHRIEELTEHRRQQAANLRNAVREGVHFPSLIDQVRALADGIDRLSIPAYVQMACLNQVIHSIMSAKTCWFAQAAPEELSRFSWRIDAKDLALTAAERLWEQLVLPMQESRSYREPLIHVYEGDYSHMKRFEMRLTDEEWEARWRVHRKGDTAPVRPSEPGFDVKAILNEDRQFCNSADELGLQVADIVASAIRRGMRGTLRPRGWWNLHKIMHLPIRNGEVVELINLHHKPRRWKVRPPYIQMLESLRGNCHLPIPSEHPRLLCS